MYTNRSIILGLSAGVTAVFLPSISAYAVTDVTSVPACIASEPKLSARVIKPWCEAVVMYYADHNPDGAEEKLAQARAIRHRNAYDNYDIDVLTMNLAQDRHDYGKAFDALESAVRSPLFMTYDTESDRAALYKNGLVFSAMQNNWPRAIWYGNHVKSLDLLNPEYSRILAAAYYENGDYADAEETAKAAVHDASGDTRKQLRNIVLNSRIKQGKEQPNIGTALFGEGGLLGALGIEVLPADGDGDGDDANDGDDLGSDDGGNSGGGDGQGGGHGGHHGGAHAGGHQGGQHTGAHQNNNNHDNRHVKHDH
jgi:tetratricopeptide (TPR) repeat protein